MEKELRFLDKYKIKSTGIDAAILISKLTEDEFYDISDLTSAAILNNALSSKEGLNLEIQQKFGENVINLVENITFFDFEIKRCGYRESLLNRVIKVNSEALLILMFLIKTNLINEPTDEYIDDIDYILTKVGYDERFYKIHKTVFNDIKNIVNQYIENRENREN